MTEPTSSRIPQRLLGLFHATALLALAACGGNGSAGAGAPVTPPAPPPPAPAAAAAGLYFGSETVTGRKLFTLVVDSGRFYQFYGPLNGSLQIDGVRVGDGALSPDGTTFTSSNLHDFQLAHSLLGTGSLSATVSVAGSIKNFDGTTGIAGTQFTSSDDGVVYRQPATLSDLSGSYSSTIGHGVLNDIATLGISTGGDLFTTAGACAVSGKLAPRSSVNVIDANLVQFGAGCGTALSGQASPYFSGHGYFSNGRLNLTLVNSDLSQVVLVLGTKQ